MMTVALILAGALLTIASCWGAGRLVFHYAGLPKNLTGAIQWGTGVAVLSTAIFALCALQLVSVASITVLGVLLVVSAILASYRKISRKDAKTPSSLRLNLASLRLCVRFFA